MRTIRFGSLLALAGALSLFSACTRSIPYPTVDLHAHVGLDSSASADAIVEAMDKYNVSHLFLMEEPRAASSSTETSIDQLISFFAAQSSRFRYLYGGNDLNPIVHALGRGVTFTADLLYPNGANNASDAADQAATLNSMAADPATWTTNFQNSATTAANSGKYVGFGEFGPMHYSRKQGQPSVEFPANHSLMKWLADLAASKSMVLDVHCEVTSTSIVELEDLVAYNRSAKIIWDHVGWTTSGEATAEIISGMMERNPNLYLSLKLRRPENSDYRKGNPFDSRGKLRKEWIDLLDAYASRIMVGMDGKYYSDGEAPSKTLGLMANMYAEAMLQLKPQTAEAVSNLTAKGLFGL